MIMSLKQRKIKFNPRKKWNHNICTLQENKIFVNFDNILEIASNILFLDEFDYCSVQSYVYVGIGDH